MDNIDYDVYDECPGKDYVKGVLISVPIGVSSRLTTNIQNVLAKGCTYGYIPTGYPVVDGDRVRVLVYFLFRSKFEARLFIRLSVGIDKRKKISDYLEIYKDIVWFHKRWIVSQCVPKSKVYLNAYHLTKMMFDKKKYFTKSEILKMKKAYDKSCPKYTPKQDSERCVGNLRNRKICYLCSLHTDRWEENMLKQNEHRKKKS